MPSAANLGGIGDHLWISEGHPIHLVVRYRDPSPEADTIRRHQEVISRRGGTWFAKAGKGLARERAAQLVEQAAHGTPTFLFLVARVHDLLQVHRGAIERLNFVPPKETAEFPEYYSEFGITSRATFWVYVRELRDVGVAGLDGLVVASSGRPIRESLRSSSPTFIITSP